MAEKQKQLWKTECKRSVLQQKRAIVPKNFNPKGIPAEITFHRVNPSGCYKEILFEDQGILEPLEVGVDKVISFTPDRNRGL